MKQLILAGIGAAIVASAIAPAASAQDFGKCLRTQYLRNHTVGDDHTLYFDYNGRDVYRLTSSNNCLAATTSSDTIVLKDRSGGTICKPIDWDIRARGAQCIITDMTKLTPDEVKALPRGKRP